MHKTKEYLSVVMYGKSKNNNRNMAFSYKMIQAMLWMASKTSVKSFLKKKNGTLPPDFNCPFEKVSAKYPAIVSCSNYVFPRPKDWSANIHQNGYWFVREETEYKPPQKLQAFLNSGEKPIYIGFGSMTPLDNDDTLLQIVIEALHKAGKRGVVSGLHGGAGTTAAGFAAGVPSIIIPFSNDQFAWAHRAYDLKVGAPPIYKKNLSANALADGITFALQDEIIENSKILGNKISTEQGTTAAVETILALLLSYNIN